VIPGYQLTQYTSTTVLWIPSEKIKTIADLLLFVSSHRRIRIGTIISFSTYVLHRHVDFWFRLLEFDDTRWMCDPITDRKSKLAHPFCYIIFVIGPCNCISQNFALFRAKIILAMLVLQRDFELEPYQQTKIPEIHINMEIKYRLRIKIIKRPWYIVMKDFRYFLVYLDLCSNTSLTCQRAYILSNFKVFIVLYLYLSSKKWKKIYFD
jgi:hypothetical protein